MNAKTVKIIRLVAEKLHVSYEYAKKSFKCLSAEQKQNFIQKARRRAQLYGK